MENLAEQITRRIKNGRFKYPSVKLFFQSIEKFKKHQFSEFSYLGDGAVSLVLKATMNGSQDVALKVVEYEERSLSEIQAAKRQYIVCQDLMNSEYFLKIYQQFDLTQIENEQLKEGGDIPVDRSSIPRKRFFVQVQELCYGSLRDKIKEFRDKQEHLDGANKESLAIQMLDALNLLHSRGIIHSNIDSSMFLVSSSQNFPIILKLRFSQLTSSSHLKIKKYQGFSDQQIDQSMVIEKQDQDEKYSLESDLQSLGIVLLELDNLRELECQERIVLIQEKLNNFEKLNLFNKNSFLFQIACQLINQLKQSAHSILLELINRQIECEMIPVYSILRKNQLKSIYLTRPKLNQQSSYDTITAINRISNLASLSDQNNKDSRQLTETQIQSALKTIFEWEEFSESFVVLKIASDELLLGARNIKFNRDSILKVSLSINKPKENQSIRIMQLCQTPYIVTLLGYRFFKDSQNNEFLVLELERCTTSLRNYLNQQHFKGEYSSHQKEIMMAQIIDSVNYLHKNQVLHRDIKLDSFFVSENTNGQVQVKLSNFNHAAKLQNNQVFNEDQLQKDSIYAPPFNCILGKINKDTSMLFQSQENNSKQQFSTQKSDCFSVGLVLILLDNFIKASESQILQNYLSSQDAQNNLFPEDKYELNRNSLIFQLSQNFLEFSIQQRKYLSNALADCIKLCPMYSAELDYSFGDQMKQSICLDVKYFCESNLDQCLSAISRFSNLASLSLNLTQKINSMDNNKDKYSVLSPLANLSTLTHLSINLAWTQIYAEDAKLLLDPLHKLKNLQTLNLDLCRNEILDTGAEHLLSPLSKLSKLSALSLNLKYTGILEKGAETLLCPLINNINLSDINLNLMFNEIGYNGAKSLLVPLSNLQNLSNLSLNLYNNAIGSNGAKYLLLPLTNLVNLSTLTLDLFHNQLGDIGAGCLLSPLAKLTNLQTVSLNLGSNEIGDNGAQFLLDPLRNLINLSTLSLHLFWNQISVDGAKYLLSPLANLRNLSTLILDLRSNQIKDIGATSLLLPLENLLNISVLAINLFNNGIGTEGAKSLLSPLLNLLNLSTLFLSLNNNKIRQEGAKYLLQPLSNLVNLSTLSLDLSGSFVGEGVQSLLSPLSNLSNLSTLSLVLMQNIIFDSGAKLLLSPLTNLINLSNLSINLSSNLIGDHGVFYLLQSLANCEALSDLFIQLSQNLYNKELQQIKRYLFSNLKNVVIL